MSYNIRANLDPLGAALMKMRRDAAAQGKDFTQQQGKIFLAIMKKESWKSAPEKAEIRAVYDNLKARNRLWAFKRNRGAKTAEAELARRLRARGTFARAWFIVKISSPSPWRYRILLKDKADYSTEIAERDGTIEKAQQRTLRGWGNKLNRVARKLAGNF